jgi:integrase/recombinase XerD
MSVSVNITLDTRRVKKKTGKYPVKLLVTFDGEPRRYQTIYDLSKEEFKNLTAARVSDDLKKIREQLKQVKRNSEDAALSLDPFTFRDFEKFFILNNPSFHQRKAIKAKTVRKVYESFGSDYDRRFPIFKLPVPEAGTILVTFLSYINKLLGEGRIRTAANYQTTYIRIAKFRGNVKFSEIDVTYLKQYERWMLDAEYSKTTVGIYTRCLRVIFNEAIFQGIIKRERCYPFGRRLYQCPMSINRKKALTLDEVEKIYYYEPICQEERKAKDFWLFSYLGNGINPTDIAHLKFKNIEDGYITFQRSKTENSTRATTKMITFYITDDLERIIRYWCNKNESPNNYLFPILQNGYSPLKEVEQIELFVQALNDWMYKIKTKLGIEKKVTTYVARHTFSTVLKRSGVSTEFIQESLGHTDIRTTENYLDTFEKEVKKEYSGMLTAFKKLNSKIAL